ncbi:MAG: glycoside hydrolase family 25 [Oscillospiraceae bacterium]|nr:glycoside hydrolase family 25 [Oscillospiraceae bacterium]
MEHAKRKIRRSVLGWFILILLGCLYLFFIYKGVLWFNMPTERKYPVRGVDASHYQGDMDWNVIANQNIRFVFLKATEGSGTIDDCFHRNLENAREAGLYAGAYHFFSFDSAAETQAENYCSVVPVLEDALPPVIDLELYRSENLPDVETVRESLRILLAKFQETYHKQPIIYTTKECWERYLNGTDLTYTLWIRSIFTKPSECHEPKWMFWQYNPRGKLDGYEGQEVWIDLNVFNGTEEEFETYFRTGTLPQ